MASGQYWVTWQDTSNDLLARSSALIWGPQDQAPPQLSGHFLAGPFNTKAEAVAYKNTIGTQDLHLPNPLHGLEAVGDFFNRLSQGQTWVRVGEVALGGILVYAGIRALTHGSPAVGSGARQTASKPVKKVAKAAITVAAPEARVASRAIAKKAAPKATARVAAHREHVAKYGQKKPYKPPPPREPRVTYRVSTIHHVKGPPK